MSGRVIRETESRADVWIGAVVDCHRRRPDIVFDPLAARDSSHEALNFAGTQVEAAFASGCALDESEFTVSEHRGAGRQGLQAILVFECRDDQSAVVEAEHASGRALG
jgi:hypothetical protein